MSTQTKDPLWTLSEKEKQTLRLMVRGHDAKSIARSLGLSVHTINERLRDARRKMAVSSSREAARLLLETEGERTAPPAPDLSGDTKTGDDATWHEADLDGTPISGMGRALSQSWIIIVGLLMTIAFALLALTALPQLASNPAPGISQAAPASPVAEAALKFLTFVDKGDWAESYQATGSAFQKQNTLRVWSDVSEKLRVSLGVVVSRTFMSQESLPAPPHGYEVVKFRTQFTNKPEAVETVTLDREDGVWRIVGVMID